MNPKDALGIKKVNTFYIPKVAIFHLAGAHMDGARKYGPFNWREKPVQASIYLSAIDRHLAQWTEREEVAEDSLVHHLGHVMGGCSILLDAQAHGTLIDDRPKGNKFPEVLKWLNEQAQRKADGLQKDRR